MIPHKFYPVYDLVKVYYQSGGLLEPKQMAKYDLSMPVEKIPTRYKG